MLGGCAAADGSGEAESSQLAHPAAEITATENTETTIAAAAPREAPPAPEYPMLASLEGRSAADLEALLGAPQFRRRDNPAELWQYRGEACVLDLILYPGGGSALAVDYLDVRGTGRDAASRQACFVSLLKARGGADKG